VDARGFEEYVGLDITPSLLKSARDTFNVENLIYADARQLPLRDQSFATAYTKDLLLHLKEEDAVKVLKELVRVGIQAFVAWGISVYTGETLLYTPLEDKQVITMLDDFWANRFSRKKLNMHCTVGKIIEGTSITEVKKKR